MPTRAVSAVELVTRTLLVWPVPTISGSELTLFDDTETVWVAPETAEPLNDSAPVIVRGVLRPCRSGIELPLDR